MVTWGIISAATAFCVGPKSFMAARFLLGLAEAGFYPGPVLYFSYWFPDLHRARIVSVSTLALPLAAAIGAPASTAILTLDVCVGAGRLQWMFLVEGTPSVLLGFVALSVLTDRPSCRSALAQRG